MREIKFRVWDKVHKKMVYYDKDCSAPDMTLNGVLLNHTTQSNVSDLYILMQFAGLKDKNGREIYEGDWIQFNPKPNSCGVIAAINGENAMVRRVVWLDEDCAWGWGLPSGLRNQSGYCFCKNNAETIFEVIGNIHENHELEKQE